VKIDCCCSLVGLYLPKWRIHMFVIINILLIEFDIIGHTTMKQSKSKKGSQIHSSGKQT
jgi:hypothetical protein